jgi:hypothetical protein
MIRVVARQPHTYMAKERMEGERYDADDRDVPFLVAFGNVQVEPIKEPQRESVPVPPPERKTKYRRRDMRAER